jgi:Fe2+ or Zn2+ uptake regulation protein
MAITKVEDRPGAWREPVFYFLIPCKLCVFSLLSEPPSVNHARRRLRGDLLTRRLPSQSGRPSTLRKIHITLISEQAPGRIRSRIYMRQDQIHVEERLRMVGLRVTPQRRIVWAAFRGGERGHLTADEVYELARQELPELSRATVYNSLGELVRAKLLRPVKGFGAVRYDPNLDPDHHHFHCQGCDRLYDVHLQGVEHLQLLGEEGFVVDRKTVLFEGYCSLCSSNG